MPKVRKGQLTPKQAKFVKAIAQGEPGYKAAQIAYNVKDYNTASTISSENMQKPNIQEALQGEMSKQGFTLEQLVTPVMKALNAKKVVEVEGDYFVTEVDDLNMQLQGVKMASTFLQLGKGENNGGVHFHNHTGEKKADYTF